MEPLWHTLADPLFGGPFRNLWPLVVAPILAALIADRAARALPRDASSWIPAALLAALPGLALLSQAAIAFTMTDGVVISWRGAVLDWLTPGIAIAWIGHGLIRAALRQREVARLFKAGRAPSARLAEAASALGLTALELPTPDRECFVAGVVKPTVFVSRGALESLNDAELAAALHHERAHVRGRDTLLLSVLSFLRDLAPWGAPSALEAYQAAREAAADREAAQRAGPLNLASALVSLARPATTAPSVALPMAKPETLRWRMQALLEEGAPEAPPRQSWMRAAGGVGAGALIVALPVAQIQLLYMVCSG